MVNAFLKDSTPDRRVEWIDFEGELSVSFKLFTLGTIIHAPSSCDQIEDDEWWKV